MNRRRKALISVIIAIAILIIVSIMASPSRTPQKTLDCHTDQIKSMSIQQASDFFNRLLVELTWLPSNMKLVPKLISYPSYVKDSPDLSNCYITLSYVEPTSPQMEIVSINFSSTSPIQLTKIPAQCSLNFSPTVTINTTCSVDVDGRNSTLSIYVTLDSGFSREDTLSIIKGMRIVEPSIKPTPTSTE